MSNQNEALQFILKNKHLVQQHMRRHEQTWADQDVNQPNEMLQIYVRSRPLLERELAEGYYTLLAVQPLYNTHVTQPVLRWAGGRFSTKTYQSDGAFAKDATSEEVYKSMDISTRVQQCVQEPGSNFSLIAYGQTGSGKTYSTTAIEEFAVEDLFATERVQDGTVLVSLSIFEIRGNSCYDLLSTPALAPIKISTTTSQDLSYGDLSNFAVKTKAEMLELIHTAKASRLTRSTVKNDTSSRSHCIAMIKILDTVTSKHSQLQIVDLAGSERFKDVTRNNADRVKESIEVNKSLAALKECIRSRLKEDASFTPWRSTKLTMVLRESLDRRSNGAVIVLACVSPSAADLDDTLNTLKWLAVGGSFETVGHGGSSGLLNKPITAWDQEESIAYIRRNFPKLAPFTPRLFPTEDVTILDLSRSSVAELSKALDVPSPSETTTPDARAINQAKASLSSTLQRLQRLLEQKEKNEVTQSSPLSSVAATPSGGMKEKARAAMRVLSGKDSTAAETGLVTRFNAQGDLVEDLIPSNPATNA